jgi:hypothetical protein
MSDKKYETQAATGDEYAQGKPHGPIDFGLDGKPVMPDDKPTFTEYDPRDEETEANQRYTRQLVESLGGMAESMGYGPTESTHGAMMPVDQEAYYQVEAHMRQEDSAGRAYGQRIHFRNVKAQIVLIPNTVFPTRTHLALQITYTTYDDSGNHQAHVLTLSENQVRTSELMACIAMMFQRPR